MSAARDAGTTLLLITHDAGQARRLGDDLAFLNEGRLIEAGPLSATLSAPKTPALRAWLEGRTWT